MGVDVSIVVSSIASVYSANEYKREGQAQEPLQCRSSGRPRNNVPVRRSTKLFFPSSTCCFSSFLWSLVSRFVIVSECRERVWLENWTRVKEKRNLSCQISRFSLCFLSLSLSPFCAGTLDNDRASWLLMIKANLADFALFISGAWSPKGDLLFVAAVSVSLSQSICVSLSPTTLIIITSPQRAFEWFFLRHNLECTKHPVLLLRYSYKHQTFFYFQFFFTWVRMPSATLGRRCIRPVKWF